jgi:hypothetical protein
MVRMDRAWQVWMMSTQRREKRSTLATIIRRMGLWIRSLSPAAPAQRAECRERSRMSSQSARSEAELDPDASFGRRFPADSAAATAASSRSTANSVQTEISDQQRNGKEPGGNRRRQLSAFRPPLQRSLGYPPLQFPAFRAIVHLPLPRDPEATCRRTERYDGKRDMYFQYAA